MNENTKYRFAVFGCDKRQLVIAGTLASQGHSVRYIGGGDTGERLTDCEICKSVDKAMAYADFAILPLPITRDKVNLSLGEEKVAIGEVVKQAKKNGTLLLGGIVPDTMEQMCNECGVEIIDYYKSESLQKKNALPSAEGALMMAMEHTDITVSGMRALVTGYGRIGKILADRLRALDASVTVAARRDETLCEISMSGFSAVRIGGEDFENAISQSQVIFNTVPSIIFTGNAMRKIKSAPLYIEIASAPGGIDSKVAREMGVEVICAPSIPGKYSPVSAGKYVFETIMEILSERGIKI